MEDPTYEVDLGSSIIYSSTGFETTIRDIASTPKVITSQEIEDRQYSTIGEALRTVTGLDIIYDTYGKPIISLRGQGYDTSSNYRAENNIKIMIDGIPNDTLDTKFGGTPMSSIPMSSIERIEIIPGGGAVVYGSGTVGGIVNIITKNRTGTHGGINFNHGEASGNLTNIFASHSIGRFNVDFTYSKENGTRYRKHDSTNMDSFIGKLRYDISDDQKLEFKYTYISEENKYPSALNGAQLKEDRRQSGITNGSPSKYNVDTKEYVLTYTNRVSDSFEFDVMAYKRYRDTDNYTLSMGSISKSYSENEKTGARAKGRYIYGDNSSLVFGIEYVKDEMFRSGTTSYDLSKDTLAIFALNSYRYNKFDFIQGIRYERADYDVQRFSRGIKIAEITPSEDEFAYELAVNYHYSDTGNVYFKYEKAFLLPPTMTLTNKSQETRDPVTGVITPETYFYNNIKPEHSNTFEIGIRDSIGNTHLSAVLYHTVTTDEITGRQPFYSMPTGGTGVWIENYNIGETERREIDLGAEHYFEKLTLRGNYSYVDAKIKKGRYSNLDLKGTKMTNVAAHKFSFGLEYRVTEKLMLMGDITYTAGMYPGNTTTVLGEDRGKQNQHTVTNIKAKYEITNGLNLYAGINNLLDEKYSYSVAQNGSTDFNYNPAPTRNYYVGFSYNF